MKALNINTEMWEDTVANRSSWRCMLKELLKTCKEKILNLAEECRTRRKAQRHGQPPPPPPLTTN